MLAAMGVFWGCKNSQAVLQNGDLVFVALPIGYDSESGSVDEAEVGARVI